MIKRPNNALRSLAIIWITSVLLGAPATSIAVTLQPGQSLSRGQGIYSNNRYYYFVMQDDGNLVLYRLVPMARALWATGTDGIAIEQAIMQTDGNLVLYDYAHRARWASGTAGQPGSFLNVQDDGNVVIYRPRFPLWATNTNETSEGCATETMLAPGDRLDRGRGIFSSNNRYYLVMQDDGNLVLYRIAGPTHALWATGTDGVAIQRAIMQYDGNLVLYDYAGRARWDSGTWGNNGAFLILQCDGNVVIYKPNVAIWATGTVQS